MCHVKSEKLEAEENETQTNVNRKKKHYLNEKKKI